MSGSLIVRNAQLVLPGRVVVGALRIEDGVIAEIGPSVGPGPGEEIDGTGLCLMPGAIDPHVCFRDPSPNPAETISSGSQAAVAGGVTSFLDAPNTDPPTTTVAALHARLERAAARSVGHYGVFMGATDDNLDELVAAERTCGVKVLLGPGARLGAGGATLEAILAKSGKLVAVHAEDREQIAEREPMYEGTTDPRDHSRIRDVDTAVDAVRLAAGLAQKHGRRLHVHHVSTAEEVELLASLGASCVSCEVTPHHLLLTEADYERLGTLGVVNPPLRTARHAAALWAHLASGTISCIASDHAPHTLREKSAPYPRTPAGMPGVEWSLPLMLDQVHRGRCSLPDLARWMCEGPAHVYGIPRKGRLEVGFDGDVVLLDLQQTRRVDGSSCWTRAGWSPWDGRELVGWPVLTAILGEPVFRHGAIVDGPRGRPLTFSARGSV